MSKEQTEQQEVQGNIDGLFARQKVLEIARELMGPISPVFRYKGKDGDRLEYCAVLKTRAMQVFEHIVDQTKSFSIPVAVEFKQGEAPIIGLCLCAAFDGLGNSLQKLLSELNGAKVKTPAFACGYHGGPENPYLRFSDLNRQLGKTGQGTEGVTLITIQGKQKIARRAITIPLGDIIPALD